MNALPPAFEQYSEEQLPQATAFGPGKNGVFEATLAREPGGETRLLEEYTKVPYHLTGTLDTDPAEGMATLCLQEPTGGVAQGDRHRVDVRARERARGHVTTQSATKVHSMHSNYAHLDATLRAGPDAHLEYVPGPTILNEDARCLQTISVELAPSSVVLVSDVLSPDGLSAHDPFGFDHYTSRLEARSEGNLVCLDTVDLQPATGHQSNMAAMGEFGALGTLYVLAPSAETETLVEAIRGHLDAVDESTAGVSALPDATGASVRVLGQRTTDVVDGIRAAWQATRALTLGADVPKDRWN